MAKGSRMPPRYCHSKPMPACRCWDRRMHLRWEPVQPQAAQLLFFAANPPDRHLNGLLARRRQDGRHGKLGLTILCAIAEDRTAATTRAMQITITKCPAAFVHPPVPFGVLFAHLRCSVPRKEVALYNARKRVKCAPL